MSSSLCPQCQNLTILSITNGYLLHPDWHSLELAATENNCIFCQMILQSMTQYLCTILPQIATNPDHLAGTLDAQGHLSALLEKWHHGLETPIYLYPTEVRVTDQPAGAYEPEGSFIHEYIEISLAEQKCEGRPRRNIAVISCGSDRQGRSSGTYPEQVFPDKGDEKKSRASYYKVNGTGMALFYPFRALQNFQFDVRSDDVLCAYLNVSGRSTPVSDSKDKELLSMIKRWRDECTQEHPECRKRSITHDNMPGRLVSINTARSDGRLYTIDVDDNFKHEYVALSYCWGSGLKKWIEQWIEIVKNIQKRNSYYEYSSLPGTIKDAVELALALDYHYIWVDCLCILQGDATDWATESEKMGYIYENADLVISATATSDCRQGFLHDRTIKHDDNCVRLPILCEPGISGILEFSQRPEPSIIDENPVSSRAWCMQERVLARRVLHWFPDEIIFECVRCRRRESEAARCFHFNTPAKRRNNWNATGDGCGKPTLEITGDFSPNLWSRLVQDFTSRNLTFQSDKLVAIAGMARRMNELSNDSYLAGQWRGWLIEDLMWYVDDKKKKKIPGKRASTWRAPSWSWASIDTPVQPYTTNEDSEYEVNPIIVETCTTTAPGRPFGQVDDGKIVLTGQIRSVSTDLLTSLPSLDDSVGLSIMQGQSTYLGWYMEDEASSLSQEVSCLRMLTERQAVDPSLRRRTEVLLVRQEGTDTFVRLGMASLFDETFFDGIEPQKIVLI